MNMNKKKSCKNCALNTDDMNGTCMHCDNNNLFVDKRSDEGQKIQKQRICAECRHQTQSQMFFDMLNCKKANWLVNKKDCACSNFSRKE